jgi:hypothetical protein
MVRFGGTAADGAGGIGGGEQRVRERRLRRCSHALAHAVVVQRRLCRAFNGLELRREERVLPQRIVGAGGLHGGQRGHGGPPQR